MVMLLDFLQLMLCGFVILGAALFLYLLITRKVLSIKFPAFPVLKVIVYALPIVAIILILWVMCGSPVSIETVKDSDITVIATTGADPLYLVTVDGEVHTFSHVKEYMPGDGALRGSYYVTYNKRTDILGATTAYHYVLYAPQIPKPLAVPQGTESDQNIILPEIYGYEVLQIGRKAEE